jgi:sugar lactone lactonase YvrE
MSLRSRVTAVFVAVPLAVTALAAGASAQAAQGSGIEPVNYLPNPYETVRDWGTLPGGRDWGSVSAIHVDIDGRHIWAGDRCGANSCAGSNVDPIVKLDAQGNVVASFGAGLILWPHGMHVDRDGNVWVVDARAANNSEREQYPESANLGHSVIKFSPQGEVLLTIGTPGTLGRPPNALSEPTDVITAPNGDIYIAEAHNAQFINERTPNAVGRISQYSADGTFIRSFGDWGFEPGEFRGPHAMAMDSQNRLFIADRGNNRLKIYDLDGNLLDVWYQFGRISGLHIDANDVLYAIDSESGMPQYNPGWRKGIRIGSARTGEVHYFIPEHVSERASGMGGHGSAGEGITVDAEGNIYSGEVGPVQGISKFIPRLLPR